MKKIGNPVVVSLKLAQDLHSFLAFSYLPAFIQVDPVSEKICANMSPSIVTKEPCNNHHSSVIFYFEKYIVRNNNKTKRNR